MIYACIEEIRKLKIRGLEEKRYRMGVGFIKGRIGSDRSQALLDLCFKEARSGSRGPIFILVPEKYTFEWKKAEY